MNLHALLLGMAGAVLAYLASARQGLLAKPLPGSVRVLAASLLAASVAAWIAAAGLGAGIAAALTCWVTAWVALPYLAWWRGAKVPSR
ncbi:MULTISPECIES: hypothetical protein [Rhodanobacter]|uniref:DUF3325 domain-containing protein n=1 Tax=Rhodanobacter hydrolyticus TaxID=2250595 RepID=A0ABW8J5M0_9GAMM|nr:hypothetical protein [Rhodanobacter sp. 7MK24]MBD8881475.1 hypothetical protein [Rhodanobacter sp. 7MK24]